MIFKINELLVILFTIQLYARFQVFIVMISLNQPSGEKTRQIY